MPLFQSTHPSGVRPGSICSMLSMLLFQSTHPSGVRPTSAAPCSCSTGFQSTHPSGVRLNVGRDPSPYDRFQSTHPSGVRRTRQRAQRHTRNFNPRTPVGCDHRELAYPPAGRISIHAPQWGATDGGESEVGRAAQFQSTHPSGVRRSNLRTMGRAPYFNPRTPVGCDSPAPQATTYR